MLSREGLAAQAAERGMPPGKVRGALREYLQVLALKHLFTEEASGRLVFLGGTALRLGYGMPRFSEDLDMDARGLEVPEWRKLLEGAAESLSARGIETEARAQGRGNLLAGELRISGVLQAFGVSVSPSEKMSVKVEANRPSYRIPSEPRVISGFGEVFPALFATPGLMFSEKILALVSRKMGRDVFDIFRMAAIKWKPDGNVLSAKGIKGSPREAIIGRVRGWPESDLAAMARRLEPFLFEPAQAELVAHARELLPSALEYLD